MKYQYTTVSALNKGFRQMYGSSQIFTTQFHTVYSQPNLALKLETGLTFEIHTLSGIIMSSKLEIVQTMKDKHNQTGPSFLKKCRLRTQFFLLPSD